MITFLCFEMERDKIAPWILLELYSLNHSAEILRFQTFVLMPKHLVNKHGLGKMAIK